MLQTHEGEFVEMIMKKSRAETDRNLKDAKKELEQSQARITKLDTIIRRLYEDNVEGKITDERFIKLSADYETEQHTLEAGKYTDITEITPELIREFVDRIYIFKAERIGGKKVQRIKILWNCIGEFTPPKSEKNGVANTT